MGVFDRLFAVDGDGGGKWGPADDRWYGPAGGAMSTAGQVVNEDTAQRISAFFRGVSLLSESVAKLPLELFERLENGDTARLKGDPLYTVLHSRPNVWQTSFEWRRQGMRDILLRGNWFNRIVFRRGRIEQLIRIPPARVRVQQLASGRLLYHEQLASGQWQPWVQDEIVHVRGVSDDGIVGLSVLTWARNSMGLAQAQTSYASRLFSQGTLHGGYLTVPGLLNDEASKRMANSFVAAEGEWHRPKVLEQGATYKESELTPEDSQMLESQTFSIWEMARWLGVPPHKLFELSRSTNNNIEHQGLEFLVDSLSPHLVNIEQAFERDLLDGDYRYKIEHNADAVMRGDSESRGNWYQTMVGIAALSPNDVLRRENQNTFPGGDRRFVQGNLRPIDEPYAPNRAAAAPANSRPRAAMSAAAAAAAVDVEVLELPAAAGVPESAPAADIAANQLHAIALSAAGRLLRKEAQALTKAARDCASSSAAFQARVREFYGKHAALVVETLAVDESAAAIYCEAQAGKAVQSLRSCEAWASAEYAASVARWALEGGEL